MSLSPYMWYVKKRTEAIRTIALKEKTTLFPITNIEFMTLQIRKIIEHIAMGNLIANKELYEFYLILFALLLHDHSFNVIVTLLYYFL